MFDHLFWPLRLNCKVPILIVTDSSSGGFNETTGFHLGQILKILDTPPWPHVEFDVTKAHRQNGGAGVEDNFRFDAHDLSRYSQIWLFGITRTSPDPLSQSELEALSQFMDQGGGVFATGDHENLGQAMAAEVPRVRSMRRWYHPNPGPNGEPTAPDQTGAGRHDTVVDTDPVTAGVQGSQSDEVPQTIRPRFYSRRTGGGPIYSVHRFPHPVLCGPDGVIRYLPDHMHEGLCEVPADLSKSYTFDGYTTQEYPSLSGHQERPQVIAWADSHNTTADDFGVLAAYDGHRSGVGRVFVDATWHHWFNINLMGFLDAVDPASPNYDPAVVPKWESIKAYYRNVATWLARPSLQSCLRNGGWLWVIHYYDILITHRSLDLVGNRLHYFWQLGTFARDALGRLASQCQSTRWVIDLILIPEWPFEFDPWHRPPRPKPDPPPWLDLEELETISLGGAVHALLDEFREERDLQRVFDKDEARVEKIARRGAAQGAIEAMQRFESAGKESQGLVKALSKHC